MELYLTPASISFITQTILFLVITIYLIQVNTHTKANFWLTGFYSVMVASSLAGFMAVSSLDLFKFTFHLHQTLILISLPLLMQFSFYFPELEPSDQKNAKFGLFLSIFVSLIALICVILKLFQVGFVIKYAEIFELTIKVLQIIFLIFILSRFIKLTFRYSKNQQKATKKARFFNPESRVAKAASGFSLSLICLLLVWITSLVLGMLGFGSLEIFVFSIGTSWSLLFLVFTLINQTTQKASFLVKLIGFVMLTVFTGISAAAWLAAPVSQANYLASNATPDRQTLHFELSNATYTISQEDFSFENDIGMQVTIPNNLSSKSVDLSVTFPFAGKNWNKLVVDQKGFVLFSEEELGEAKLNLPMHTNPVIAALYLEDLPVTENTVVFVNLVDDRSVFTWFLVTPLDNPDQTINAQLVLFPDGSFDISYNGIQSTFKYNPYLPKELTQISGYFLGENDNNPSRIQFNSLLPFTSESWSGVYQDYYIDFRSFLHQSMSMQLLALLLVTIVTALIFPIFFQNSLWYPINMIRFGLQQITQDNFKIQLEPKYTDELGQTIMEFNHMAKHVEVKRKADETRINELEEKLSHRTYELKTSIEKLGREVDYRKKLSEALDKSIAQQKKYATQDDLTGINNRAHFVEICEEEIKRSKRYGTPLSFVIMDPDYLRMINDTYGNATGDEVLKELAQLVHTKLRETDTLGRIGGEEFAILMPQTAGKDAQTAANRIRNIIGSQSLQTSKGPIRISVSFGVSEMPLEGIFSVDILFHRANQALDHAKNQGRNSVVIWNSLLENKEKE